MAITVEHPVIHEAFLLVICSQSKVNSFPFLFLHVDRQNML